VCPVFPFVAVDPDCPSWERSHAAVRELGRLIPNFQKKIDEGSPEELSEFYAEVIFVDVVVFTY